MSAFSVPVTDASSRYMSAAEQAAGRTQTVLAVDLDLGAERRERHQVGVDAAAADHVATRRRDVGRAEAGQQRPGAAGSTRGSAAQLRIECGRA